MDGRVVSWGEVLWDEYPDGARLGGAPANLAYHLATLGRPVTLISRVGADERGRRAIADLASAGVDVRAIQLDPVRPTGAVAVKVVDGEARYALRPDAAWEAIELDAAGRAALADAGVLCLGALALRRGIAAAAAAVAALPQGAEVASDPNLRDGRDAPATLRWLLEQARVLKLNEHEAEVLGARLGVPDVVAWLLDQGARLIAITRGARGARLVTPSARIDHDGVAAAPGGDSVGCGDAFTAALLHHRLAGSSLERTVEAACRYGAFVAGHRGAMPPVPADVLAAVR
jgi:fructokinase